MDFTSDIKRAIKEVIKELGKEDKILFVENLNITVRLASGGGAVSCETYHEADRK